MQLTTWNRLFLQLAICTLDVRSFDLVFIEVFFALDLFEIKASRGHLSQDMCLNNVYKMSSRSVSVYTDTSASHKYLCTLIQNGHEFCKLLIKRPQTLMFSNYI